jgi:hypothetical protein
MGIEPTSEAWEASILPLNYARPLLANATKPGGVLQEVLNTEPESTDKHR